jgi:hypothetical protein
MLILVLLLHSLDPIREEPELEVQAEEANIDPEQGKTRCITPQSLTFIWITIIMLRLIVH